MCSWISLPCLWSPGSRSLLYSSHRPMYCLVCSLCPDRNPCEITRALASTQTLQSLHWKEETAGGQVLSGDCPSARPTHYGPTPSGDSSCFCLIAWQPVPSNSPYTDRHRWQCFFRKNEKGKIDFFLSSPDPAIFNRPLLHTAPFSSKLTPPSPSGIPKVLSCSPQICNVVFF